MCAIINQVENLEASILKKLLSYIENLQDLIFACDFKEADKLFLEKIYLLEDVVSKIPLTDLTYFNEIMLEVFSAKQKQDYLLIADLFEYKLKPFLFKIKSLSL